MPKRVVIFDLSDKRTRVIESSLAPLTAARSLLPQHAGYDASVVLVPKDAHLTDVVRQHSPDIALLLTNWIHTPGYVEFCVNMTREGLAGKGKVAIFDTFDPSNTPHLSSLPLVDGYLKKVVFRDSAAYTKNYVGGYIVTDKLCHEFGYEIGRHELGSLADAQHLHKIRLSWSFGASPQYRSLLRFGKLLSRKFTSRDIDVSCRLGASVDQLLLTGAALREMNWYRRHRLEALRAIKAAGGSFKHSSADRCSRRTYLLELYRTKCVISPFGYGELCYRDYEAVCCGALLLKPDVSHLRTKPDIFVANETYVPLRWDFADVPEKLNHYLKHPDEAARIAHNATQRMRDYFANKSFLADVKDALDGL